MMPNPRKPTKLRILQGNPGKRPLPKGEPDPPELSADTPPPDWLVAPEAKAAWSRIAEILAQMGVLTVADPLALTEMCRLQGRSDALDAAGEPPSISLSAELRAYYGRFGMTPADRARVAKVDRKPEGKLQTFLGGKP